MQPDVRACSGRREEGTRGRRWAAHPSLIHHGRGAICVPAPRIQGAAGETASVVGQAMRVRTFPQGLRNLTRGGLDGPRGVATLAWRMVAGVAFRVVAVVALWGWSAASHFSHVQPHRARGRPGPDMLSSGKFALLYYRHEGLSNVKRRVFAARPQDCIQFAERVAQKCHTRD